MSSIELKAYHNPITIGLLLRARRAANKQTHKDISDAMGYAHANVLSMVEHGRLNIPQQRIFDFAREYGLGNLVALAFLKSLYPETYEFLLVMQEVVPGSVSPEEVDAKVEEHFLKALREHDLIDDQGVPRGEDGSPLEGNLFPRRKEDPKRGRGAAHGRMKKAANAARAE